MKNQKNYPIVRWLVVLATVAILLVINVVWRETLFCTHSTLIGLFVLFIQLWVLYDSTMPTKVRKNMRESVRERLYCLIEKAGKMKSLTASKTISLLARFIFERLSKTHVDLDRKSQSEIKTLVDDDFYFATKAYQGPLKEEVMKMVKSKKSDAVTRRVMQYCRTCIAK